MTDLPQTSARHRWLRLVSLKLDASLRGVNIALNGEDGQHAAEHMSYDPKLWEKLVLLKAALLDAQDECDEKSNEEADRCMTAGVHTTTCADDAANRSDLGCQDVPALPTRTVRRTNLVFDGTVLVPETWL
jgi:hypothetical protein